MGKKTEEWRVVRNDEEQYTLWPDDQTLPDGWHDVGVRGDEASCIAHVAATWHDLRPRALRELTVS